jgi:hypothetical protein
MSAIELTSRGIIQRNFAGKVGELMASKLPFMTAVMHFRIALSAVV